VEREPQEPRGRLPVQLELVKLSLGGGVSKIGKEKDRSPMPKVVEVRGNAQVCEKQTLIKSKGDGSVWQEKWLEK